jgi:addiction module HigA family antidote
MARTTWRSWITTDEEVEMSVKNGMRPVHPGEILGEELEELGMSANALAGALGVPANRISAIIKGQRGVTADTALRLSRYLGTTPQIWLNLQKMFELRVAEIESAKDIERRVQPRDTMQFASARPSLQVAEDKRPY